MDRARPEHVYRGAEAGRSEVPEARRRGDPEKLICMIKCVSLALALSLMGFGQVIADKCLSYEPTEVTLKGTLHAQVFPGPPNYESIKNGDRKETALLLKLSGNICTIGNDDFGGPERDIRVVQMVIKRDGDWKTVRRL